MIKAEISPKLQIANLLSEKIKSNLVFEIFESRPIYFSKYKEVLNGNLDENEITFSSSLKGFICNYLLNILFEKLDLNNFIPLTGRTIIHIDNKNNLSSDIIILDKNIFNVKDADHNYINKSPKIYFQININADTEDFGSPDNYVFKKTEKLLNFGVEKVIWIMSDSKKVIVATKNANWEVIDWYKQIGIMDGIYFNIGEYLKENESPFA